MEKKLLLVLVLTAALVAPIGYFTLLINWVKNYSTGVYGHKPIEAAFETMGLLIYTYFGIRFFSRNINSLR